MPVSHSFEGQYVVLSMRGHYSTQELRDAVEAALTDPQRTPLTALLFDLRESLSLEGRTAADVAKMARFLGERGAMYGNRLAMVAPTDLAYGLMRMGAVLAENGGVESAVFRDIASAVEWLERGTAGR